MEKFLMFILYFLLFFFSLNLIIKIAVNYSRYCVVSNFKNKIAKKQYVKLVNLFGPADLISNEIGGFVFWKDVDGVDETITSIFIKDDFPCINIIAKMSIPNHLIDDLYEIDPNSKYDNDKKELCVNGESIEECKKKLKLIKESFNGYLTEPGFAESVNQRGIAGSRARGGGPIEIGGTQ